MVDPLRTNVAQFARRARVAGRVVLAAILLGVAVSSPAQEPEVHYWHHGTMPPGAIGSLQLARGGPLPGYFQPVKITAPPGAMIAMAEGGAFGEPLAAPARVALLVGPVYRIRVTNIPLHTGLEVFPTVEIINRLYTPRGQEIRFPILIELTREDLELALAGKFVTRVIYLEDPEKALPIALPEDEQSWFEAGPGRDPLAIADSLGRPVAILRMGARLPEMNGGFDPTFLCGSPPLVKFPPEAKLLGPPPSALPAQPVPAPPAAVEPSQPRTTALPQSPR